MNYAMRMDALLPDLIMPAEVASIVVSGLSLDSRQVRPGHAFVALAGGRGHGLDHAAEALAAGAAAILFEPPKTARDPAPQPAVAVPDLRAGLGSMANRFYRAPSRDIAVIGVTGTNGKTSTVQLLAQALDRGAHPAASIGTLGVGRPGALQPGERTTPDVLSVHRTLAELRDQGIEQVAMEVSSHALDQCRVDGVRFRVAVFTNLTRDHLDYHGTMECYGAAKASLFDWPGLGAAVINLDDSFGSQLFDRLAGPISPLGVSACGDARARVRAEALSLDMQGIGFELNVDGRICPVRSSLLGRFNADNLLAVAGVLHALDWPVEAIAARLDALQPVPGRIQRLGGGEQLPLVVIDYAHTPDALEKLLDTLRDHAGRRILCLFGCGGERDPGKRPEMAAIAERLADVVWVSDDNPRGEDGDAIVADIMAGFRQPDAVVVQRDRAKAIAGIIAAARPGDVVVIAGKGHEAYQEVDGLRRPFDDAASAAAALETLA